MPKDSVDLGRRKFLVWLTALMGAVGAFFAAIPFLASWLPSARAKAAGAPVEVDLTRLQPGEMLVVEWRGKPVWVIRRTEQMLKSLNSSSAQLRDEQSEVKQQPQYAQNTYRSIDPEYLVLVGICTHLGCSPTYMPGVGELGPEWPGGFYCPCHGSKFDLAGRVYTGVPAPINLEVPPYRYVDNNTIIIGEDSRGATA